MELTLPSGPVRPSPGRAPSTPAKNRPLRRPALSRIGPTWTGRARPSKLTGSDAASRWPAGSGHLAWLPAAYQAIPVCLPCSNSEKVKVNATSAFA
jgi:hypothetical protein